METVADLIKRLTDNYDPAEPIKAYYWTKGDVADHLANYDGNLAPTNAQAEKILSEFSVSDYAWQQIDEDFTEAVNDELGDFRCDLCYGYYNEEHLAVIDGEKTCVECGEEPDAPLYSTSNEVVGEPSEA
jgi:hypothetical protein